MQEKNDLLHEHLALRKKNKTAFSDILLKIKVKN